MIDTSAVHGKPGYWPLPSKKTSGDDDGRLNTARSFDPGRWLHRRHVPTPGSFIPFAEASRSCMGVRFTRVEFCAAIAALLKGYWVELGDGDGEESAVAEGVGLEKD
jgi:hypothetical protein